MDDCDTAVQKMLTLIIRSSNRSCEDQTIEGVGVDWTIKELKTHLSAVYPSNPPERDQRIIYAGKLLLDHQHVSDVFGKLEATPIIHMVCAFRPQAAGPPGPQPKVAAAELNGGGSSSPGDGLTQQSATAPPTTLADDGLRNRGQPPARTPGSGSPMNQPVFPTYSLYSPQQLLWLQRVYAQQYYMQYQAALAAAASSSSPVASAASRALPVDPQPAAVPAALPNQPANQNVPEPHLINPAGANQNLRMNAQGGPVMEEDDGVEHDWLEWVYTAARFSVFLGIMYFYSSISRFVLVMCSLVLMYLHTAGWFPFRRMPVVPGPREQAPELVQNQDRDPELVHVPAGGADAEDGDGRRPSEPVVLQVPRLSIFQTAWVFFKAFFASLVPEAPQGIAN
ncbi:homocysteine-responsive endoplasmic reticulum-resident ubiquitin-like domain member 1 protein [Paramormyrops kingsleyae]|uniref:Homocysteine-inducible, endoplasmic reticulum stress-inducible, ubiquitin-like domain member 1 n=1 Tax=Paramormyrops kingsleyae TaxID=1676925 RepID=A0A3B3RB82_9TELE|nr:homocysteine-responsive endoplasmic reticulum-resident ubiquitin-like domain member 1 protein [Paramormyrops kingsleyae]